MGMPDTHYTVQLIAMKTREELDQFARRHGLKGTLAARVEREGELYYVLLLGVYEVFEEAQTAVAGLPAPVHEAKPWIRPLRSLQAAMARAEAPTPSGGG